MKKTYKVANQEKLNNFQLKNKRAVYANYERIIQNKRLVKQISEISKRKRQYIDILDKQVDGQNIYYLVGHSRGNIFHNNTGNY